MDSPAFLVKPDDPEVLNQFLFLALEERVLLPWEAAQILDECLESVSPQVVMPEVLRPALQRLELWQMEASPTQH